MEFGAASFCVFEGDGHVFLWGGQGFAGHGCAAEIVALGIGDAPLAGLLADDEDPLIFAGQGEERVGAGGDVEGDDLEVRCSDEGGGGIGSGAPDFAVGNDVGADGAALEAR